MSPATSSDLSEQLLWLVSWCSLFLFVLALVLMVLIFVLRARLIRAERRKQRFLARWKPLIMESLDNDAQRFPPIAEEDWLTFLDLWNHLHGFLRGPARERLNRMGRRVGISRIAGALLKQGRMRNRLIAILTLGNLRAEKAWEMLLGLLEAESAFLSLIAMRALLRIDAQAALPLLVPQISTRGDWSAVRVAAILYEAGPEVVAAPLAVAALDSSPEQAILLLRYLSAMRSTLAGPTVRQLLKEAPEGEDTLVAACLQTMREPEDLFLVREHLKHEVWFVRMHAAAALGKIGLPGDEQLLAPLLEDREWWVRYRAAQAIAMFPFIEMKALEDLEASQQDKYARDILRQVMAERRLA